MLRYDLYTGWYFPSNGSRANVILRGFALFLQGQIFQMQISLKLLAKHEPYGFYTFWYLSLNDAIPKVVLCDVCLLFQGQIFQMLISRKLCELRKYAKYDFYRHWYLPSNSSHCVNHTNNFVVKLQIFTKLFQQICLHLHGTCLRSAPVL